MKRVTRSIKIVAGAIVVFLACASVTWGVREATQQDRAAGSVSSASFRTNPGEPWKPRVVGFGDNTAKAVSLAEARAQAAFPVLAPSADALSSAVPDVIAGSPAATPAATGTPPDNAVRVIWLDHQAFEDGSRRDVVAIEYNRLEITEAQMDSSYDGPRSYDGMVDQQADPNAYLETVHGSTAYVAPPNNEQGMAHPGYVMFMEGNTQVIVEGYYPVARLIAIANSLTR